MLIWSNLERDGTGNGFSNIKDTFAESLQLQTCLQLLQLLQKVFQMCTKVCAVSSLQGWSLKLI